MEGTNTDARRMGEMSSRARGIMAETIRISGMLILSF